MTDRPAQEFAIGRSKTTHGLVIAAVGIVVGLGTILFADESITDRYLMGGLLAALGVGVGLHAWRTGRATGAHLRIDDEGVAFREWGTTIPWREIADVYQSGSRLQPFIALRIGDPERLLAALPQEDARKLRRNRLWKAPELRIPYSAVEATRDEILAAIRSGLTPEAGNPPVA